ncbi:MAG: Rrf2 family transcriptional regulator [Planctomycetales bacterium]|nr:Rrf2 family transcriptional regulator [Planctomycetales bacterium]
MFSQTVEYALRAVLHLAHMSPAAQTTDQIAQATRVPAAYLSKVLQSLRRSEMIKSQRGVHGGMTLQRDPETLTILEVVNAVDPICRITSCPLKLASHGENLCPLHRRLDDALALVEDAFHSTTVAQVLAEPTRSIPLCDGLLAEPIARTRSGSPGARSGSPQARSGKPGARSGTSAVKAKPRTTGKARTPRETS